MLFTLLLLLCCFSCSSSRSCPPDLKTLNIICKCKNNIPVVINCSGSEKDNSTSTITDITDFLKSVTKGQIKTLVIDITGLEAIPSRMFENYIIILLTITTQNISTLPSDVFFGVSKVLESLSLRNNMFVHVPSSSLKVLFNLRELDLSNNLIVSLEAQDFAGMPLLELLYLNSNMIHSIAARTFQYLNDLKELYLDHNNITVLYKDNFIGLQNLKHLYLDMNKLISLSTDVFINLQDLADVYLDENLIYSLANMTAESSSIRMISMQNNNLKGQLNENTFSGMPNLREIYLTDNDLEEITTNALSKLVQLQILVLINNRIKTISNNAFTHLWNLITLDLGNNQIQSLPITAFYNLTSLSSLLINNNQLEKLTCEHTVDLLNLEIINLNDNRLSNVEAGAFTQSYNIVTISLKGNPFICDCALNEFVLLLKTIPEITDAGECAVPSPLLGKNLIEIDFDSMNCGNTSITCQSPTLQPSVVTHSITSWRTTASLQTTLKIILLSTDFEVKNKELPLTWMVLGSAHIASYRCMLTYKNVGGMSFEQKLPLTCPSLDNSGSQSVTLLDMHEDVEYEVCFIILDKTSTVVKNCTNLIPRLEITTVFPSSSMNTTQSVGITINTATYVGTNHFSEINTATSTFVDTSKSSGITSETSAFMDTTESSRVSIHTSTNVNTIHSPETTTETSNFVDTTVLPVVTTKINNLIDTTESFVVFTDNSTYTNMTQLPKVATEAKTPRVFNNTSIYIHATQPPVDPSETNFYDNITQTPDFNTKTQYVDTTRASLVSDESTSQAPIVNTATEGIIINTLEHDTTSITSSPSSSTTTPVKQHNTTDGERAQGFNYGLSTALQDTKFNSLLISWNLYQYESPDLCSLQLMVLMNSEVVLERKGMNCTVGSFSIKKLKPGELYTICLVIDHAIWGEYRNCTMFLMSNSIDDSGGILPRSLLIGLIVLIIMIIILIIIVIVVCKKRKKSRHTDKEKEKVSKQIKLKKRSGTYSVNDTSIKM
ncbi:uncharacterized protein LOC106468768 [Limulus polyphemus]|uniref:Uncharacterized protein LOC106468768 n=1 Tax=Limulus polyphemus TaxID=6850 RepID=A0ABM1BLY5_LIMPO|nr:uncharacterized protein LOC106468768 [Limulus polyphemus]